MPIDAKLGRWRWWLEGQRRLRDGMGSFDQTIVRPGVGYTVLPRTVLCGKGTQATIESSPLSSSSYRE